MKREYVLPVMSLDQFMTNDSIAVKCAPGIDESKVEKTLVQCYYYGKDSSFFEPSCSNKNTDQYFFIDGTSQGCTIRLKSDGSVVTSSGISTEHWCYSHAESTNSKGVHTMLFGAITCTAGKSGYKWDNKAGGYHHIPATEFGGTVGGKPKYFVS